jgi:4-hydroxy-tetrahydrodipicolinate synthase
MTDRALPTGVVTPLVVFLTEDGAPDRAATKALVEHQIAAGVNGLLVNGSTGELGNLAPAERSAVLRTVVETAAGRVPVWAGVAGLGTADAVSAAREAEADGADAALVLPPLFFDTSDAELAVHFRTVAAAIGIPVLAYDVPARTPRKLPVPLVRDLAEEGVLRGLKDSSGNLTAGRQLCAATEHVAGFVTYLGSEITLDLAAYLGFDGVVPGLANILPAPAVAVFDAARSGDPARAAEAQRTYQRLLDILDVPLDGAGFSARAIAAIKVAAAVVLDLPVPGMTAPFTQPDAAFVAGVTELVQQLRTLR